MDKSRNWDILKDKTGRIHGFPFNEGFPRDHVGKRYELILEDGRHLKYARVDASRQYSAEGMQWIVPGGDVWGRHYVAAWREMEPNEYQGAP